MSWRLPFKIHRICLSFTVCFFLTNCDMRPTTMGEQQQIFVVADSLVWADLKDDITATFEAELKTPHIETSFTVNWIPLEKVNTYKTRMNIFFVGLLNEPGLTNDYLKKILPESFLQGIAEGKFFYVFNNDLYARDQIGLFMLANDRASFKQYFADMKNDIYQTFEIDYFKRLKDTMFEKGEQKRLETYLAKQFGWKVRIQHDYFLANQNLVNKMVWLRRMDPNRWLTIWEMPGDSARLTLDSLIHYRNKMAEQFYEGDHVIREDTRLSDAALGERSAKKLTGLWINDSLLVGGPFRMYALYDEQRSKLYLIDLAVMAPGRYKKPYLDQLEVIASTFEIVDEKK